jgi:hypothetical protein
MTRQELAEAVLTVLRSSTQPLEVKEILRRLGERSVTKSDVNSVLHGNSVLHERSRTADAAPVQATGSVVVETRRPQPVSGVGKANPAFTADDLASVSAAVREEIAATQQQVNSSSPSKPATPGTRSRRW